MTQNQTTLSLIEKIAGSNKYIETKINDTDNTYIWHSETGKNTCENCKSLDNVKFYPGDKMILPPLHPHCKCELEVIQEDKKEQNEYEYEYKYEYIVPIHEAPSPIIEGSVSMEDVCNNKQIGINEPEVNEYGVDENKEFLEQRMQEFLQSEDIINKISADTKEAEKTIEKDVDFDIQQLDEQINAIEPSFDMDLGILESEKENHEPNCIELNKRIEEVKNKKAEFEKIKNQVEDNKKKIEEIRKKLKETHHVIESLRIDAQFLMEKIHDGILEDKLSNKILELISKTKLLSDKSQQILNSIKLMLEENAILKNTLFNIVSLQLVSMAKFTCNCASVIIDKKPADIAIIDEIGKTVSPLFPIAGSNIQDAMHDFQYANKNPNVRVLNSRDELEDKTLNEPLDKYKVDKNMKGVEYLPESSQSQKIFHSKIIQNYIEENLEALIEANGKPLPDKGLHYSPDKEPDAYLGIQTFFIHGARITKDGYFEADLVDKFDFEKRKIKTITDVATVPVNNKGYKMQELGLLQNYFLIYHIKEKIW